MNISFVHSKGADGPITIPAIGLDLKVRMAPASSGGAFSITETINAPGKGPPRHRHPEAEIFRVLEGRYLYEMDSRRFYAEAGDVVSIPGGAEHRFVNVTNKPARQCILIVPALDAATFFTDLAARVLGVLFVLAGTLQEEISACVASLCWDASTRLSAVEDNPERGPWRKRSAGGRNVAKREASRSGTRQRTSVAPAGLEIAFRVEPGRSTTTIGVSSAIKRQ